MGGLFEQVLGIFMQKSATAGRIALEALDELNRIAEALETLAKLETEKAKRNG